MSWPRLGVVKVVTVFDVNENRGKECERLGKITERKGFENSVPDTGLGVCTFGTDTITRQAKPSWVVAKKDYPTSQQVTHAPVDAVQHHCCLEFLFRSLLLLTM